MTKTKTCTKCDKEKPLEEFHKHRTAKDGRHPRCKTCRCTDGRKYYAEHREEARAYNRSRSYSGRYAGSMLLRRYGIALIEYDAMLEAQGGVCAICGMTPEEHGKGERAWKWGSVMGLKVRVREICLCQVITDNPFPIEGMVLR